MEWEVTERFLSERVTSHLTCEENNCLQGGEWWRRGRERKTEGRYPVRYCTGFGETGVLD